MFANRRADRLKVLVYDGAGMWLCTRRLQAGSFAWPREDAGTPNLTREQFDWLVARLPWQRLGAREPQATQLQDAYEVRGAFYLGCLP